MCGIAGILDFDGVNAKELRDMTDAVRHRGPDDEGFALIKRDDMIALRGTDTVSELNTLPKIGTLSFDEKYFLGLGHRRLSIIDTSASGHQPMSTSDGRLTIVYNGEIYNYIELREELKSEGYIFKTTSDTEVLLSAYDKWGCDCVSHFNGMWAFALWDAKKSVLFCSRDRLGVKPFYYHISGNLIYFGSEIKQFINLNSLKRTANIPIIGAYVLFKASNFNNETWINEIKCLGAGCNMIVNVDAERRKITDIREYAYWDLDANAAYVHMDEYECIDAVKKEFERACAIRMRSDVPVGAALSGGIDSSCIVMEICKQLKEKGKNPASLNTFTTYFPDNPDIDETYYANLVNKHTGASGNLVTPKIDNFYRDYKKLVYTLEGAAPFSVMSGVAGEIASHGIKVCLNGQGGDETMFGYERYYSFYFMDLLKNFKFRKLSHEYRLASKHSKLNLKTLTASFFYFNFPSLRIMRKKHYAKKYCSKKLMDATPFTHIKKMYTFMNLEALVVSELTSTHLPFILALDDKGYMSQSIETRIPFLDYKYIELALKIPQQYKIADGYTKFILRKIMEDADKLPDAVVWRTHKLPYPSPVGKNLQTLNNSDVEKLMENPKSVLLFDINKIKKNFPANKFEESIEKFMNVELFLKIFDVEIAS